MNIIRVENLTKQFNGFTVVDHINFEVKKGEIFGFLGPNGAGKSTTINMLSTILPVTDGEAFIMTSVFYLKETMCENPLASFFKTRH